MIKALQGCHEYPNTKLQKQNIKQPKIPNLRRKSGKNFTMAVHRGILTEIQTNPEKHLIRSFVKPYLWILMLPHSLIISYIYWHECRSLAGNVCCEY